MNHFVCKKCGLTRLGYIKYINCLTPVQIQKDGTLYYSPSITDENDYLAVTNGFCCQNCFLMLEHCGYRIETEKELLVYLSMDPEVKKQQERQYEASIDTEIYLQEQQKKEEAQLDQQIADNEKLLIEQ